MLTVRCVTINARDPQSLAVFWAQLVGGTPHDSGNDFVLLDPGQGRIPLLFQKSDRPNQQPGWIHLDCSATDRQAAIERLVELGGRVVAHRSDSHAEWVVLADPEGDPFCV
jgi:predicted enzyme related to lactoylglutathione lyase